MIFSMLFPRKEEKPPECQQENESSALGTEGCTAALTIPVECFIGQK